MAAGQDVIWGWRGGALSCEFRQRSGAPPHSHAVSEEPVHVLEGTLRFTVGSGGIWDSGGGSQPQIRHVVIGCKGSTPI
jgi:hypothetical protein